MAGDEFVHERGVADVATADLDRLVVDLVQPTGGTEGIVQRERGHFRVGGGQGLDQVRADEAVGAGDQHPALFVGVAERDHARL